MSLSPSLRVTRHTVLFLCVAVGLHSEPLAAALYQVDSTVDAADLLPGDGVCLSTAGGCTLRAAVQEAGAAAELDTIQLPAGEYLLTLAGTGEDAAATGDLDLLGALNVVGASDGATIVRSAVADRVLDVQTGGSVALTRLVLREGGGVLAGGGLRNAGVVALTAVEIVANGGAQKPVQTGAGVFNLGALLMTGGRLADNIASGAAPQIPGQGGGLYSTTGAVLSGVVIEGNQALGNSGAGGAVYALAPGVVQLLGVTLLDNRAVFGGGIQSQGASLTVQNSTLAGNQAARDGGALRQSSGTLALLNSTFSGNLAGEDGGAVDLAGGSAEGRNLTLSNNRADADGSGSGDGGGLVIGAGASLSLRHGVLADNADDSPAGTHHQDCSGALTSLGYNLLGSATGCSVSPCSGDLIGLPANLLPLADNGGPTLTHLPAAGSPLLDAGDPAGCTQLDGQPLPTDQRGVPRPQDAEGNGSSVCDIGAVEVRPGNLSTTVCNISGHSPDPSESGQVVEASVQVSATAGSSTPTGTITVTASDGSQCRLDLPAASCALALQQRGAQLLVASYSGDALHAGCSAAASHQVLAPDAVFADGFE